MSVRKIFIVLITIVICVILGAFVLNVIMPNTVSALIDAVESTIYNSTGMQFDLNKDGSVMTTATSGASFGGTATDSEGNAEGGANVAGYK